MIWQIRIEVKEGAPQKDKGDFLEDTFRSLMERQRYQITQRLRFTGTEIDLLCKHLDRQSDTALVECKAKITVVAEDLKNFAFDLLVSKKADHGYFVHTSELQQAAAGIREELVRDHGPSVTFIGPEKLVGLLVEANLVNAPPIQEANANAIPTKMILLYTPHQKAWVCVYAVGTAPTHYSVTSASGQPFGGVDLQTVQNCLNEELQGLELLPETPNLRHIPLSQKEHEVIAEVQESQEWQDLRPVGSKFFVGRDAIAQRLYHFVRTPIDEGSAPRVFFVESKSGWGKSSLLAHIRARARNKRNRNTLFVMVIDSRSASTSAFVGLSVLKLLNAAAGAKFLPQELIEGIRIPSWFDVMSDQGFMPLLDWLKQNHRVIVLAFDQFEDVFRKHDLFRAFHKLMMDTVSRQANLVLGFSWKSEINIPIDNPAYGLWQQAREHSTSFEVEKFSASEVNRVIAQLQQQSQHQLPTPLKRRLKEGSQGFPWLIKKLATHCYYEMLKGLNPDDLVDQDLNVKDLFDRDRESLTPEEGRALKLIAQRGYEGDAFDVSEVGDRVDEEVLNRLLSKRLVIRTGGKYTVYWDIFRDYIVEDKPPRLDESFLFRQYPAPCIEMLKVLMSSSVANVQQLCQMMRVKEGTALNLLRELRNFGAAAKSGSGFAVRAGIDSESVFKEFIGARLDNHVVVHTLRHSGKDRIDLEDIAHTLRTTYSNLSFSTKTWLTYASFLTSWLRYCDIDLGRRLAAEPLHRSINIEAYTPQSRPEKLLEILAWLSTQQDPIPRHSDKRFEKPLYDLKVLGVLIYSRDRIYLTRVGNSLLKGEKSRWQSLLVDLAMMSPKIRSAAVALTVADSDSNMSFEAGIRDILDSIISPSYRSLTRTVLKSWARFVNTSRLLP
ncbi:restriction endonuclease [Patescibacteria group bacterium]|nr:restriction endonuclease [Patescibacteria group bacterium]